MPQGVGTTTIHAVPHLRGAQQLQPIPKYIAPPRYSATAGSTPEGHTHHKHRKHRIATKVETAAVENVSKVTATKARTQPHAVSEVLSDESLSNLTAPKGRCNQGYYEALRNPESQDYKNKQQVTEDQCPRGANQLRLSQACE